MKKKKNKFKFKQGEMYYFRWHDASSSLGWRKLEQALKADPSIIENVGVYLGETEQEYVFAASHDLTASLVSEVMYRPKANILSVKRVK